jgi:hypothetical protein
LLSQNQVERIPAKEAAKVKPLAGALFARDKNTFFAAVITFALIASPKQMLTNYRLAAGFFLRFPVLSIGNLWCRTFSPFACCIDMMDSSSSLEPEAS